MKCYSEILKVRRKDEVSNMIVREKVRLIVDSTVDLIKQRKL